MIDWLFIKFIKKEELNMSEIKYSIVSDIDNKIICNKIEEKEVDRLEVESRRARIEELKKSIEDRNSLNEKDLAEIAEIEALVAEDEKIVKLADEDQIKKQMESEAQNVELDNATEEVESIKE
jgi:hypothetical protein